MDKEKEYVCGYKYCLHDGKKVSSLESLKDGTRHYHPDCHKEKQQKQQTFDLYYKYYKSTEDYHLVRKVLVQLINEGEQRFSSEYVLFVLCQAIREKVPFKGIFTLSWLVKNNMQFKQKYNAFKSKEKIKDFTFENTQTNTREIISYKKSGDDSWENTLFS